MVLVGSFPNLKSCLVGTVLRTIVKLWETDIWALLNFDKNFLALGSKDTHQEDNKKLKNKKCTEFKIAYLASHLIYYQINAQRSFYDIKFKTFKEMSFR